jgi:hypothetical protein
VNRIAAAAALAAGFWSATGVASAQDALAQIERQLKQPDVVCGEFVQSRVLAGITKPIRSNGRFCLVRDRGVLWRTTAPFAGELLLRDGQWIERRDGRELRRLAADREPALRFVTDVLLSVLGGRLEDMRQRFEINAALVPGGWRAQLMPRDATLKRGLSSIELAGAEYVTRAAFVTAGGDRTELLFSAQQSGRTALRPEDAAALD